MMGRNSVRSGPGLNLVLCEIEYRLLISVLSGVYLCWLIVSTKVFFWRVITPTPYVQRSSLIGRCMPSPRTVQDKKRNLYLVSVGNRIV